MSEDSLVVLMMVIVLTSIYGTVCLSYLNRENFVVVVLIASIVYLGGLWVTTEVRENLYNTVDWCIPYLEKEEDNKGRGEEEEEDYDLFPRIDITKLA